MRMSEYIVSVPDEEAELFIARFGIEGTHIFGHRLVGEIVRCRDCKFFATNIHGSYCTKSITTLCDSNGFCAWAERKVDA